MVSVPSVVAVVALDRKPGEHSLEPGKRQTEAKQGASAEETDPRSFKSSSVSVAEVGNTDCAFARLAVIHRGRCRRSLAKDECSIRPYQASEGAQPASDEGKV